MGEERLQLVKIKFILSYLSSEELKIKRDYPLVDNMGNSTFVAVLIRIQRLVDSCLSAREYLFILRYGLIVSEC